MKKMIIMAVLSLWGVSLVQATSLASQTNQTTVTSASQTIIVTPAKPEFSLQLEANPTTGYRWSVVQYDTRLLTLIDNQFLAPESKLIGAGGVEIWTFKANAAAFTTPTTTRITLEYARPWEQQAGIKRHFKIVIKPSSRG